MPWHLGIVLLIWQQWQDIALRNCSGPMRSQRDGSRCRHGEPEQRPVDRGKEGKIHMPSLRRRHCLLYGGCPWFVFSWRFKCHRCGMATTLLDFVRGHAAHLLLPSLEVLEMPPQEPIDASGHEERVTRLPPNQGISDALWRSRHLPRHLYRGNRRILSDEHQ